MTTKKTQESSSLNAWMVSTIIFAALLFLSLVWNGVLTVMIMQGGIAAVPGAQAPTPSPTPNPGAAPAPGEPVEVSIEGRPIKGDADAPVTVVEFSDFECSFCQRFYRDTMPSIESNYVETGDAKFVYRHFQLFGDRSIPPMVAAECAFQIGGNDAFWPVHDAIFENPSGHSSDQLRGYVEATGVDMSAWDTCFANGQGSEEVRAIIEADVADGRAAGVSGTPTLFVNGNRIVGAQPFSVFQAAIDAEI